jgi:cytochrome c oxidase subunit 2
MAIAIVLIVLVVGTVLFHIFNPWWFTPIASNWQMIDNTVNLTVWVTGLVFIAVNLFVAYAVIRFRHKENSRAAYEPENKKLEIWLTGLTTVGIMVLLAPGLFVWAQFVAVPEDAIEVEVVGQQWGWSYRYPGADGELGASDPRFFAADNPLGLDPDDPAGQDDILVAGNEVYLPLNVPVKFLARSKDVLHNFAVPQFRVKMDMVPGMVTHFWLTPTRTGTFDVLCMELCGIGHYVMRGRVVIAEEQEFDQWLATQPSFADTLAKAARVSAAGAGHYATCVACHGSDGEGNPELNAPNLAGLDKHYVARQLHNFRNGKRGADSRDTLGQQMVAMAGVLPDDEAIASVSAYIASLPGQSAAGVAAALPGDVQRGKKLFRNCSVCHGDNGEGIWNMGAPRLAGMASGYLATQLKNFRDGLRGSHRDDQYGQQMAAMASILGGNSAIDDVVAYIATLDPQGERVGADNLQAATGRGE